ncbi:MAG: decaprenyl-phosphate phosphoribosyltransferase, partial [Chlamydiia bacterium]|nr:decaprenyl-phosphate phosphoribosyltransferase [Chlamydiia bacterium]
MRPQQWVKNAFVFTGLVFGHAWNEPGMTLKVTAIAIAFCMMSSAIYTVNDILDRERDRKHPRKSKRPVASGAVSVVAASRLGVILALSALVIAGYSSTAAAGIILSYGLLNIAYSFHLKHVVILDVFCIAMGFMLRIMAGTVGVGIPPSQWLLLCGLMVTLFLGFAKRRAEIIKLEQESRHHRRVLEAYQPLVLDEIMGVCGALVIISYSLYTMSAETIIMHETDQLIYTVPAVTYGLFRYLFLLHGENQGDDPSRTLFRDK